MFHKEGVRIIGIAILLCIIINVLSHYFIGTIWLQWFLLVITVVLTTLITQFFRNPLRQTAIDDSYITSAVDGTVVAIEEVYEKEYFKDKRLQVSVFMSPLNVHVTRYPVNGEILVSKHHMGKYLVAWHPKSSELNERTTVVLKSKEFGEILYRQVAGAMARRIVNYAKIGQEAVQGEDSGFIKFGSRVDLFLPLTAKIKVELEQKVRGGETIIAMS